MINTCKIKGRMVELGLNQNDVAKALKIAQCTLNQKVNNIRTLTLDEAEKLSVILKIKSELFTEYFFT